LDQFHENAETFSRFAPVFARFNVVFPRGCRANHQWDSFVAPTVLLNWLRQRQGGLPPKHMLGLVIKSLNQGGPYFHANDIAPGNLAAANATAIFSLLNDQPEFGEQSADK
jgi:hypothetical protein